jgi:hypothetical protein
MTTFLFVLAIYAALAGLVAYARRDRFTGAAIVAARHHGPRPGPASSSPSWARRHRVRRTSSQASQCIC